MLLFETNVNNITFHKHINHGVHYRKWLWRTLYDIFPMFSPTLLYLEQFTFCNNCFARNVWTLTSLPQTDTNIYPPKSCVVPNCRHWLAAWTTRPAHSDQSIVPILTEQAELLSQSNQSLFSADFKIFSEYQRIKFTVLIKYNVGAS